MHGDLHHDNILLRKDGSYAMIDPKGVAGPEILDLPRYIMNEIDRLISWRLCWGMSGALKMEKKSMQKR